MIDGGRYLCNLSIKAALDARPLPSQLAQVYIERKVFLLSKVTSMINSLKTANTYGGYNTYSHSQTYAYL
jgi:hypothetical protein